MSERLLVNYWYAHNVGHAVEGLRYCLGHKAANPELSVSLLLNAATPVELARLCPFIDNVYAVEFTTFMEVPTDPAEALASVPREWDWIVENHRAREESHQSFPGFRAFFDAAHGYFVSPHPTGVAGLGPPEYRRHQQLRLDPPPEARAAAAALIPEGRTAITVVPTGSSNRLLYPSAASWELILAGLAEGRPDAILCLTGKLVQDGRTVSRIGREEVDRLLAALPEAIDCFDRPLLEQLALLERSALLVSPHTGFSFLASTVGTPWLAVSGGNWHESFFNGVPFHSVIPSPERYTPFAWAVPGDDPSLILEADEDGEGPRAASMSAARIRANLPELLDAADALIEKKISYEDALRNYFPRLLKAYGGDRGMIFSFDNVHSDYV